MRASGLPRPRLGLPPVPGRLWNNPVFRLALLAFGLLAVIALAADLTLRLRQDAAPPVPSEADALVLGIRDRHYQDPAGRFHITVPAAWQVLRGEAAGGYNVVFRGPLGLECMIRVSDLDHDRFARLMQDIYAIEEQWGVNMNIQAKTWDDQPYVERRVRLLEQKVLAFDFLDGNVGHHIQFGAPRDDFDRFEPLFLDIIATYRAL